jgi:hypothetical protein
MLPIRRKVDELACLDEADLSFTPTLKCTVQNDERLRLARMYVAGSHASQPGPLLDH